MMQNDAMGAQWIKDDEDNPVTQLKQWTHPYTTYVGQYTITLDDSTKIGKTKNSIEGLWGATLPKLLLANSDKEFDSIYNTFMKKRYNMGFEQVLKAYTKQMKINIKKLGLDK